MELRSNDNDIQNDSNIYSIKLPNRYYKFQNEWYFYTREGEILGPYHDKFSAKQGVSDYLEFLSLASSTVLQQYFKNSSETKT